MPRTLMMLTRHGKGEAVAPALATAGFRVQEHDAFGTAMPGTFTGEIPRAEIRACPCCGHAGRRPLRDTAAPTRRDARNP